jgi:hypothetical protein
MGHKGHSSFCINIIHTFILTSVNIKCVVSFSTNQTYVFATLVFRPKVAGAYSDHSGTVRVEEACCRRYSIYWRPHSRLWSVFLNIVENFWGNTFYPFLYHKKKSNLNTHFYPNSKYPIVFITYQTQKWPGRHVCHLF